MSGQGFDPTRYLTKVSGRDYLTVQWRLVWLRTEHPLAQIDTELVKLGESGAIFKATITLPLESIEPATGEMLPQLWSASATGYGSETADDFGDYLEKAETKAIGRALAALGYGTQFALDFDAPVSDAPVQRSAPPPRSAPSQPPARSGDTVSPVGNQPTERQMKYVHALLREKHWPDTAFKGYLAKTYQVESLTELDRRQVSQIVEYLNSQGEYVDPNQRRLPVGAPDDELDDPWDDR